MLTNERRNIIKKVLESKKSTKVSELADKFEVSKQTIRRDLKELCERGIADKIHGGAILNDAYHQSLENVPKLYKRKEKNKEEKLSIAKKALNLLEEETNFVLLDAGTTTESIAKKLTDNYFSNSGLSIVTNGLNVAEEAAKCDELVNLYILGGKLRPKTLSIIGDSAIKEIKKFNIEIVFMGTTGIDLKKGFASSDIDEINTKSAMVSTSEKVVMVADHTKFGEDSFKYFASWQDIDAVVTSSLVDNDIIKKIKEKNNIELFITEFKK